jgi:ZIP family zinc transporter
MRFSVCAGKGAHRSLDAFGGSRQSLVTPISAVVGVLVLRAASPAAGGLLEAVSAGLLLAMAAETMVPEAFEGSPQYSGAVAALGFVLFAALTAS